MKKLLIAFSLLFSVNASAQDAPLVAPVPHPAEATLKIGRVDISDAPYVLIQVNVIGSDASVVRYYNVDVPRQAGDDQAHPTASIVGFLKYLPFLPAGGDWGCRTPSQLPSPDLAQE